MSLGKQLARIYNLFVISDYSAWETATEYGVNDVVSHNTDYYICIQAHTSAAGNEPGEIDNDWEDYWDAMDDEYLKIEGVTSFSPSPEKNDADTTDFDSEGWQEHLAVSRGLSFDVEGLHIEDATTGIRQAGQEEIERVGKLVGRQAITDFRLVAPDETNIDFEVSVQAPLEGISSGGGNDDPAGWSLTLTVKGDPTTE